MTSNQQASIINTIYTKDILQTYSSLVTHHEIVTHDGFIDGKPIATNYELHVVYNTDTAMVDIYIRRDDYSSQLDYYVFDYSLLLEEYMMSNSENEFAKTLPTIISEQTGYKMTRTASQINRSNPVAIARSHPTLKYYHVETSYNGYRKSYDQTLHVVFLVGKKLMVNIYWRELDRYDDDDTEPYYLQATKTLVDVFRRLNRLDPMYAHLKRLFGGGFINNHHFHFRGWLEKARENIVTREMHPNRIQMLLDSGVDLDDIETTIDSKLAGKLSY